MFSAPPEWSTGMSSPPLTPTPARTAAPAAVAISGLRKSFRVAGETVAAGSGGDLTGGAAERFGLLGPNGAGKTTTLRILTTLLPADAGSARVAGVDVLAEPAVVRRRIGYVSQLGGADKSATGRENLLLAGRLYGLSAADAARRCDELAGVFDLGELITRPVRTSSGGQRRRLELALGIMHRPQVLFLDEPTTGLDPQNRANLWDQLRQLRAAGTTICLTTHYLDEADQLCDREAIIDRGRVIALGAPDQLKGRYSASTIKVTNHVARPGMTALERQLANAAAAQPISTVNGVIRLTVTDPTAAMAAVFGVLPGRWVN